MEAVMKLSDDLPDDALVPWGWAKKKIGEQGREEEPLRVLSTGEAARQFGYKPKTWRTWCEEKRIDGAYLDEGNRWRLPVRSVRAHLLRLEKRANRSKRGARGPYRRSS